jgi:hypothetical protein
MLIRLPITPACWIDPNDVSCVRVDKNMVGPDDAQTEVSIVIVHTTQGYAVAGRADGESAAEAAETIAVMVSQATLVDVDWDDSVLQS